MVALYVCLSQTQYRSKRGVQPLENGEQKNAILISFAFCLASMKAISALEMCGEKKGNGYAGCSLAGDTKIGKMRHVYKTEAKKCIRAKEHFLSVRHCSDGGQLLCC